MNERLKAGRFTCVRRGVVFMAILFILALIAPANAADFQAGMEAYERGDGAAALRELRPFAEQGDAVAQTALGLMYMEGRGVPKHNAEAVKWFRMAAGQGDALAQYWLGTMYASGHGVAKDVAEAVKWWRWAAEQGHAGAQYNLGILYRAGAVGNVVSRDWVQAYAWFNIAAAQGNKDAARDRKDLGETMTREQRARAQELSREYWEAYVLPFRN